MNPEFNFLHEESYNDDPWFFCSDPDIDNLDWLPDDLCPTSGCPDCGCAYENVLMVQAQIVALTMMVLVSLSGPRFKSWLHEWLALSLNVSTDTSM